MKKTICIILTLAILLCTVSACSDNKEEIYTADNEIFTYQKIDPEKTQIVVSRTGNISVEEVCNAFMQENPNIQIIYLDITGGNNDYIPLIDWITKGYMPDVVFSTAGFFDESLTLQYFENLSDHPIISNYEAAALARIAIDSNVYWLPGPSNINAMMYNKTLFDTYGWKVPNTFDEFITLCDQIKADTNGTVEAWNPNAKYSNELKTVIEAFVYEELLGGLENRKWYNEVIDGNATFSEHMIPCLEVIDTLVKHGLLKEEHFSYSATTRGNEFSQGKIAMTNGNIYDADNDLYDFGFMPFPTTQGQIGYLCDNYSCYVGVPKKEHTDKQEEAINAFLQYFSSAQGQAAYIGKGMKISNVKGVKLSQNDDLATLIPATEAGHMFGLMEFYSDQDGSIKINLHSLAREMTLNGLTIEQCAKFADEVLSKTDAPAQAVPPEVLAVAKEDFTILETSFYIADTYVKATGAEIGLITNNEIYRGNMMRIFAGDITKKMVTVFKPRSFDNGSKLLKVSMSGEQLIKALNNPMGNNKTADCIYAYSGLKCTVAPQNDLGSKYISVTLSDSSEILPDKLYTVAIWEGTVFEQYITQVLDSYDLTWEEMMINQLSLDKELIPDSSRIELVWE